MITFRRWLKQQQGRNDPVGAGIGFHQHRADAIRRVGIDQLRHVLDCTLRALFGIGSAEGTAVAVGWQCVAHVHGLRIDLGARATVARKRHRGITRTVIRAIAGDHPTVRVPARLT